jgi:hypothetical protein
MNMVIAKVLGTKLTVSLGFAAIGAGLILGTTSLPQRLAARPARRLRR